MKKRKLNRLYEATFDVTLTLKRDIAAADDETALEEVEDLEDDILCGMDIEGTGGDVDTCELTLLRFRDRAGRWRRVDVDVIRRKRAIRKKNPPRSPRRRRT